MKAIVIAGGSLSEPAFYKPFFRQADLVVCADSGYLHCNRMGITPNLIIGDFDSSSLSGVPEGVPITQLPVEKDKTDLHACIDYAISQGADEILLFGARGTRLDHSFAAISLVYMGLLQGVTIRTIDEHNEMFMFSKTAVIPRKEGYKLSLLPITPVTGVYAEGVYYPLSGQSMDWGNPYGVSNEFTADVAKIAVESGVLMAIVSRD